MPTVCTVHVGASTIQSLVLDKEGNRSSHLKGKTIKDKDISKGVYMYINIYYICLKKNIYIYISYIYYIRILQII